MHPTSSGWSKILTTLGMALGTTLAAALGTETARQMVGGIKTKGDKGDASPGAMDPGVQEEIARLRRESDAARARADRLELELADLRAALHRGAGSGPSKTD